MSFQTIAATKVVAQKVHSFAASAVARKRSGKARKRTEPWPGELMFGRIAGPPLPESEYDRIEYPINPSNWKVHIVGGRSIVPPNRENCATATVGNDLYLFGGMGGGPDGRYNTMAIFNFNTLDWRAGRSIKGTAPEPCCKHTLTAYGRRIYLYGGEGTFEGHQCSGNDRCTRHVSSKMYCFDTDEASWRALPTVGAPPERRIPFARRSHSACLVDDFESGPSLLVFAGVGLEPVKSRDRHFNDMWAFNLELESWTFVYQKGEVPSPRAGHTATRIGENIFVYGGAGTSGTLNDMHRFHVPTLTWYPVQMHGASPGPLFGHVAAKHPWSPDTGRIVIYGGRCANSSAPPHQDIYCFDCKTGLWTIVKTRGRKPPPRFGMVGWTVRKCLAIYGGCSVDGYCNSNISILEFAEPPLVHRDHGLVEQLSKLRDEGSALEDITLAGEGTAVAAEVGGSAIEIDDTNLRGAGMLTYQPSFSYLSFKDHVGRSPVLSSSESLNYRSSIFLGYSEGLGASAITVPGESSGQATSASINRVRPSSSGDEARGTIPAGASQPSMASRDGEVPVSSSLASSSSGAAAPEDGYSTTAGPPGFAPVERPESRNLGNGEFFVDMHGHPEESVRPDERKTWMQKYLSRCYLPPAKVRRKDALARPRSVGALPRVDLRPRSSLRSSLTTAPVLGGSASAHNI